MEAASRSPGRIVLAEGGEPRVLDAAVSAARRRIAEIILLGDETEIRAQLRRRGIRDEIQVVNPQKDRRLESYISEYSRIRGDRLSGPGEARDVMSGALGFAAMMVRQGDADGTIAGAVATTADTIRAALRIIGRAPGTKLVSSFFLMFPAEGPGPFADRVLFRRLRTGGRAGRI